MKGLMFNVGCLMLFSALLIGCAEIKPPTPRDVMRQPLGTDPIRIGMTKEKVRSIWGEPDMINVLEGGGRVMVQVEWIYRGRYPNLPIDVGYLAETQHLFFDGDNLVEISQ